MRKLVIVALAGLALAVPQIASALPHLSEAEARHYAKSYVRPVFSSYWREAAPRSIEGWNRFDRSRGKFEDASWTWRGRVFEGWIKVKYVRTEGVTYNDVAWRIIATKPNGDRTLYRLRYGRGTFCSEEPLP